MMDGETQIKFPKISSYPTEHRQHLNSSDPAKELSLILTVTHQTQQQCVGRMCKVYFSNLKTPVGLAWKRVNSQHSTAIELSVCQQKCLTIRLEGLPTEVALCVWVLT